LFITNPTRPEWLERVQIGDENSLLRKKMLLEV
jgi:hypothetical protein